MVPHNTSFIEIQMLKTQMPCI